MRSYNFYAYPVGKTTAERYICYVFIRLFMKTKILPICVSVTFLLAATFACKPEENPVIPTCRLTSTNDQVVAADGQLTDEIKRTFTYNAATLTTLAEKTKNQDVTFTVTYADQRVRSAAGGQDVVTFGYGSAATSPTSATFTRGGKVMSTFGMEYTTAGRLSKIVESRQILPTGSLTKERAFTLTYDTNGNLTNEQVRFTLNDGSVVEQETEYTFDTKPAPYKRLSELPLLTVVALSQAVETRPGRFWHNNNCIALKSYNLTSTGSRSNLRESSTFTPVYDADNKVMTQDQAALLYQASVPNPVSKKNLQTFTYQCE